MLKTLITYNDGRKNRPMNKEMEYLFFVSNEFVKSSE